MWNFLNGLMHRWYDATPPRYRLVVLIIFSWIFSWAFVFSSPWVAIKVGTFTSSPIVYAGSGNKNVWVCQLFYIGSVPAVEDGGYSVAAQNAPTLQDNNCIIGGSELVPSRPLPNSTDHLTRIIISWHGDWGISAGFYYY